MRIDCLDKGFVRLVDVMGDDSSIVQMARVSYGEGTKTPSSDRKLIRYLMRHRHTSPFEGVQFKFHVKLPIFISNQWVRHRTQSINQMSGRYSVMPDECYVPNTNDVTLQSSANKQGGSDECMKDSKYWIQHFSEEQEWARDAYEARIESGMRRDLARINIPLCQYTEMYTTMNLKNLLHFIGLRISSHAQLEIVPYAKALLEIAKTHCPYAVEAWEDYELNAVRFSKQELECLEMAMSRGRMESVAEKILESKREYREFCDKISGIMKLGNQPEDDSFSTFPDIWSKDFKDKK